MINFDNYNYDYKIIDNQLIIIDITGLTTMNDNIEFVVDYLIDKHNTGFGRVYVRDYKKCWFVYDYKNEVQQPINESEEKWLNEIDWR